MCIRHWACARPHFPSHSLCKICDCPSNKYAEHISSYHNVDIYKSTTRSGIFFGFSFSDLKLNRGNVVMLGEWMYCISVQKQHPCQGLNITEMQRTEQLLQLEKVVWGTSV